jgi:hypothetical protein
MNEVEDGDIHEHCNRSGKFVDNFAGHRYVFWSDSRLYVVWFGKY